MDSDHSDGISVISETSTHRALDEQWDHSEETLSLSAQAPSQKFTSSNLVFIGGIFACVAMIIANFASMGSETLTPIAHNDNTSLLAQRVELLELENEALRILVEKLMRTSDKEPLDRKVKKIKVWTGEGNSVDKTYIEKNKKKHQKFFDCNNFELNTDDLYSEYRRNQCEMMKLNENKLKTEIGGESKTVPAKSKHDKRAGASPTPDIRPDQKVTLKIDQYERTEKKHKSKADKLSKYNDNIAEEYLKKSRKPVIEQNQAKPNNEFKTKQKREKGTEKWNKSGDFEVKRNTRHPDKHAENIPDVKPPKYRSF